MQNGCTFWPGQVCVQRHAGTPQGGPLSPLLASLLLDDLDEELEQRGHRFCSYADDGNIHVGTNGRRPRWRGSWKTGYD